MFKSIVTILVLFFLASSTIAQEGFKDRPITNNLYGPTAYTLNKGEFTVGIGSIGFGITDEVQVGTNILLFLFQISNADVKINFSNSGTTAFGGGVKWYNFDLDVIDLDASFTSISPYIALTNKVGEKTLLHLSGQISFFSGDADIDDAEVEAESSSTGTSFTAGLEHSYSNKTKFLFDAGYDMTFEGLKMGGGVLFGWTKFRLKLGISYYKPKDVDDFTFPNVGLWWRFKG